MNGKAAWRQREAAIATWYGDDLEQTTLIELTREHAAAILSAAEQAAEK